jgi:hypothetical protein
MVDLPHRLLYLDVAQSDCASFWYYLVVPFGLAVWAAAMAVSEKRRQRSDEATKQ